jgi:hypothetical protein
LDDTLFDLVGHLSKVCLERGRGRGQNLGERWVFRPVLNEIVPSYSKEGKGGSRRKWTCTDVDLELSDDAVVVLFPEGVRWIGFEQDLDVHTRLCLCRNRVETLELKLG